MKINTHARLLTSADWHDYALLDTGAGRKLEQIGPYVFDRPEPQCLWPKAMPDLWAKADATFAAKEDYKDEGKDEESESGQWAFRNRPPAEWPLAYRAVQFYARQLNNRHIGFFPEQAAQWDELTAVMAPGFRLLNAFAYTGLFSLLAAKTGAEVTHVDASKKALEWARENAALNKLDNVRWILEDARAFIAREKRRGKSYDGIMLDPPKFGRGPDGDVWHFFTDMPALLADAATLLSEQAKFFVITGYSARLSPRSLAEVLASTLSAHGGVIDYGECALADKSGRKLALNMYAKWSAA